VEGLYQPRGLLVKEILDPTPNLAQLSVLGMDQSFPASTAIFFPVNL
jgi:hypothetical protein